MTRFVVDAGAVLHLLSAEVEVSGEHELLAPTLLRSQTLSALHEAVRRGELPAEVGRERLAQVGRMPIRLLGDAALTQLQADALVTLDAELARSVQGIVATAPIDALR
jgi:predicted nucleic acid-binding protein